MFRDFKTYSIADADASSGPRGWLRTARRALKRCWLDQNLIKSRRIFCQNIGGCGSTYIVQLLRDNGIEGAFHEKAPDLETLGVEHFESPISRHRLIRILRYTRYNVFFEANNRVFTMSRELSAAFPNARFIHLYRDPAQAVRSAMSKPNVVPYLKSNVRLRTSISGPASATPFEKFCHHWKIANQRILDDLDEVKRQTGQEFLTLRFDDLIAGNLSSFEDFAGIKLAKRTRPPVNQRQDRPEGKFPEFNDWTRSEQETLGQICSSLLAELDARSGFQDPSRVSPVLNPTFQNRAG